MTVHEKRKSNLRRYTDFDTETSLPGVYQYCFSFDLPEHLGIQDGSQSTTCQKVTLICIQIYLNIAKLYSVLVLH